MLGLENVCFLLSHGQPPQQLLSSSRCWEVLSPRHWSIEKNASLVIGKTVLMSSRLTDTNGKNFPNSRIGSSE